MAIRTRNRHKRTSGFSLLEMLIVVAIITIMGGIALDGVSLYMQRYKAEETKLDMVQESREFLDQLTRDLHQSGYPTRQMFAGAAPTDSRVAQGISGFVASDATDIQFFGDVDGDGLINLVEYALFDSNGVQVSKGGTAPCPCTLKRSQLLKSDGANPTPVFTTELQNVINSNGQLALTPASDDTKYSTYKAAPIFAAYNQDGSQWVGANGLGAIRSINITINVLAAKPDPKTGVKNVMSMEATGYVGNVQF
jgi:prepilin-type N-terminal cleavage/methylation domain-containing protein